MTGIKISALPAVVTPALTDILPEVQGGITQKVTLLQIQTLFGFSPGGVLPPANGGTGVNNGTSTLTLAGNLATTGAFNSVFAIPGAFTYTFPPATQTLLGLLGGTITSPISYASAPVANNELVNKLYVDSTAQGRQIKDPSDAATTTALTVTYNNGSSGFGATLTNAGAQVALVVDGITMAVGNRLLVKNQASSFQNGIYTVTNIGSGATNWILTRAVDMDSPTEFKTGTTLVIGGTVNAGTTWTETLAVTTVGTDPVTFIQTGATASGTVTSVSVATANNFSGTVATATTTPAITIGANTNYAIAETGNVSNVTGDGTLYNIVPANIETNPGSIMAAGTGIITLAATGMYILTGSIALTNLGAAHTNLLIAYSGATGSQSGVIADLNPFANAVSGALSVPFSIPIKGTAADTYRVNITVSGSTKTVGVSTNGIWGIALIR